MKALGFHETVVCDECLFHLDLTLHISKCAFADMALNSVKMYSIIQCECVPDDDLWLPENDL